MKNPTKAEQQAFIRTMITSNPRWAEQAVMRIYEAQTDDEQVKETTINDNGVGFNGLDAQFLTGCAKTIMCYGHLSNKQLPWVFKKIGKYSKQLMKCSTFDEAKLIAIMLKHQA